MGKNQNKLKEKELVEKAERYISKLSGYKEYAIPLILLLIFSSDIKSFLNGEGEDPVGLILFGILLLVWFGNLIAQNKSIKTYRVNLRKNLFKVPYTAPLNKILNILDLESSGGSSGKMFETIMNAGNVLNPQISSNASHPAQRAFDLKKFMCGYKDDKPYVRNGRLTRQTSRTIAKIWDKLGYKIEPDVRHSVRKTYKLDEVVCIYKDDKNFPTTRYYEEAALFADFGCGIIEEKGGDSLAERRKIEEILTQAFMLNPSEKLRLQTRLELPVFSSRSDRGRVIQRLIKKSGKKSRVLILKFVIAIVASDGIIQVKEQLILKEILSQLGLKPEYLTQLLSDLSLKNGVTIEDNAAKTSLKRQETETWRLDMDKLSNVMLNTAEIHQTLQEIFTDEEDENENNQSGIKWYDDDFYQVSLSVISQKVWTKADLLDIFKYSRSEFEEAYPTIGSFVDDLNDWAEENYGDFLLLEEGNVYKLNEDVAALIESEEKENSNEFEE